MPLKLTRLNADEISKEFKRPSNSQENLTDYIDSLNGLTVGDGFSVKVIEVVREDKPVEVVEIDDDGNTDTVRAFKRRMNAAADTLNLKLKWRPKGHRVGTGEEAHFATDWLVVKAMSTKATSNGGSTAK